MVFRCRVFKDSSNPPGAAKLARDFAKYVPLQQSARQDVQLKSFCPRPLSRMCSMNLTVDNNSLYSRPSDSATYGPLVLAILILFLPV